MVLEVYTWRISLNLWPRAFCFSFGNKWFSLGARWRLYVECTNIAQLKICKVFKLICWPSLWYCLGMVVSRNILAHFDVASNSIFSLGIPRKTSITKASFRTKLKPGTTRMCVRSLWFGARDVACFLWCDNFCWEILSNKPEKITQLMW